MTRQLTPFELAALDRALAKRTAGRVRVGRKAMTRDQGIALWEASAPLARSIAGVTTPRDVDTTTHRHVIGAGTLLAATTALSACATLGGNVKADFACRAPDGTCAPTSTIDDAALALIAGEGATVTPAGPYSPTQTSPRSTLASAVPIRSNEKVLRIVFPAHIDGAGRFREASAVHAVVERGAWMAAGSVAVAPVRTSSLGNTATRLAVDVSALQPVDRSIPSTRSLGELAAAAPEVRFPDPVADLDVQAARSEVAASDPVQTSASTGKPTASAVVASRPQRSAMLSASAPVSSAAQTPMPMASPGAAISYSMPPKAQVMPSPANPLDAIRAQVADQLRARPSATALAVAPIAPGSAGVAGVVRAPANPTNAPSLFPVSEVNR
jgi:conjugal transfer pilus assembly protein TraV